jgi:hypothetical protein
MAKRIWRDPEQEARWAEEQRELERIAQRLRARIDEDRERAERCRRRLERLSFGLLGREYPPRDEELGGSGRRVP